MNAERTAAFGPDSDASVMLLSATVPVAGPVVAASPNLLIDVTDVTAVALCACQIIFATIASSMAWTN